MKAKWMTNLMIALCSGAFAVGAVASAEGMGSSYGSGYQKNGNISMSQLDTNGDGVISQQEASDHAALSSSFQKLDSNGDGKLDQAEFARFETKPTQTMQSGQSGTESKSGSKSEGWW